MRGRWVRQFQVVWLRDPGEYLNVLGLLSCKWEAQSLRLSICIFPKCCRWQSCTVNVRASVAERSPREHGFPRRADVRLCTMYTRMSWLLRKRLKDNLLPLLWGWLPTSDKVSMCVPWSGNKNCVRIMTVTTDSTCACPKTSNERIPVFLLFLLPLKV